MSETDSRQRISVGILGSIGGIDTDAKHSLPEKRLKSANQAGGNGDTGAEAESEARALLVEV